MGGISQYVLHLLPALAAIDDENRYTIFHSVKDKISYHPLIKDFHRRNLYTPCHHKLERYALSAEAVPHRLDVWHSPDFIPPQRGGRRHIITVHDLNFIHFPQFLTAESTRYYANQIQWAVDHADHISADSEATRQDIITHLHVPPQQVSTIYLAANPLYQRDHDTAAIEATLATHNLPHGFILFVGTLEPRKNLPMLLRAYKKLLMETAVSVPLVLVGGKGWIYDDIFATIDALDLRPHVRHLSGIFDDALAHLYHAAGVLVTPSHYEGFGLPALEAMHCNCPVIVSNRGSLPEIVGEHGLQLDPDDPDLWAETIERVLTDSELRKVMVKNGRLQAQNFNWQQTARDTLSLYRG